MLTECIKGGSLDWRPGWLLKFRYDAEIIERLKAEVPHYDREWRPDEGRWWVADLWTHVLRGLFKNFEALAYQQQCMFTDEPGGRDEG